MLFVSFPDTPESSGKLTATMCTQLPSLICAQLGLQSQAGKGGAYSKVGTACSAKRHLNKTRKKGEDKWPHLAKLVFLCAIFAWKLSDKNWHTHRIHVTRAHQTAKCKSLNSFGKKDFLVSFISNGVSSCLHNYTYIYHITCS